MSDMHDLAMEILDRYAEHGREAALAWAAEAGIPDGAVGLAWAGSAEAGIAVACLLAAPDGRATVSARGGRVADRIAAVAEVTGVDPDSDPALAAAVVLAVASDLGVDPSDLTILASHPDPEVRRRVGANPSTPAEVLATLARDSDPTVRLAVAAEATS
jgi:hypothetical protein